MIIAKDTAGTRLQLKAIGKEPSAPREPLGRRSKTDGSEEILVEPDAGVRLIHYRGVRRCEADDRTIARVILALVLGEEAAELGARQFAKDFLPTLGTWRVTVAQLRAWAAGQS